MSCKSVVYSILIVDGEGQAMVHVNQRLLELLSILFRALLLREGINSLEAILAYF